MAGSIKALLTALRKTDLRSAGLAERCGSDTEREANLLRFGAGRTFVWERAGQPIASLC